MRPSLLIYRCDTAGFRSVTCAKARVELLTKAPEAPEEPPKTTAVVPSCILRSAVVRLRMWINPVRLSVDTTFCVPLLVDGLIRGEAHKAESSLTLRTCIRDVSDKAKKENFD